MKWYYMDGGQPQGPVEDAAFDELASKGTVRDDTPVWREGMANWQAYSTVKVVKVSAPVATPVAVVKSAPEPDNRFCTDCGTRFLADPTAPPAQAHLCPKCRLALDAPPVVQPVVQPVPRGVPQRVIQPVGEPAAQPVVQPVAQPAMPLVVNNSPAPSGEHSEKVTRRYTDGYRAARAVNGIGAAVKILGIIAALITVAGGVAAYFLQPTQAPYYAIAQVGAAVISAILVWLMSWIWGVLISALGQNLRATLDGAVNTSPFLTTPQRARVMSLD